MRRPWRSSGTAAADMVDVLVNTCSHIQQGLSNSSRAPQELASSGRSITTLFTHDDWEYHQTTSRYFRNLFNIGGSAVFRRCLAVRCPYTVIAPSVSAPQPARSDHGRGWRPGNLL